MSNKPSTKIQPKNFSAMSKWREIPPEYRAKILDNGYCGTCKLTTIVDYTIDEDDYGLIIRGKCKKCGGLVVRVLEGE